MDKLTVAGVTLRLIRGDITAQQVDAVVNAANSSLLGGGGVDGAIHRRGGPAILEACRAIRKEQYPDGLPTGQAVTTTGGQLPATHVIHTVGPVWHGGSRQEPILLADAYRNSLAQARAQGLRTIAFPAISTGVYGFPMTRAAPIALETTADYVRQYAGDFDEVRFVLFSEDDFAVYARSLEAMTPQ